MHRLFHANEYETCASGEFYPLICIFNVFKMLALLLRIIPNKINLKAFGLFCVLHFCVD